MCVVVDLQLTGATAQTRHLATHTLLRPPLHPGICVAARTYGRTPFCQFQLCCFVMLVCNRLFYTCKSGHGCAPSHMKA